jgi:hypothetical protein
VTFKPRLWEPIAWILTAINVGGVWLAAAEPLHATTHAMLAAAFAVWAVHLRRRGRQALPDASTGERLAELEDRLVEFDRLPDVDARLAELEERLDFVERALIDVRARAQLPPKE